jgi:hypothetical protein
MHEEEAANSADQDEASHHDGALSPRSRLRRHKKDQDRRGKLRRLLATQTMVDQACLADVTFAKRIALPAAGLRIDWEAIPGCLSPNFMNDRLANRGERKQQQCESFLRICEPVIRDLLQLHGRTVRVADFGCGTGNASLPLAWAMRSLDVDWTLIDRYAKPVSIVRERVEQAGLTRVKAVHSSIADVQDNFDLVLAFHVCGGASDEAIDKALQLRCSFIMCPCCIGKLKFSQSTIVAGDGSGRRGISQYSESSG